MNTRRIGLVIGREYKTRVKKKSFLVITFLVPVLFALMCTLPTIIMMNAKEESKRIAVVDASGVVMPALEDTETMSFTDCSTEIVDSLKINLEELGYDAVLDISPLDTMKSLTADIYSIKPLGVMMTDNLNATINEAVEDYRVSVSGVDGLAELMEGIKSDISMTSYTIDETGKAQVTESGVFMAVSMLLGMIIFMFVTMFSAMVMSSVIEEKSSRVVEVLVSSVKATELLFGKIIGVALVALTQFLLWILLTGAILGVVSVAVGPDLFGGMDMEQVTQMAGGEQMAEMTEAVSQPSELEAILSTLSNMPIAQIIIAFVIFFIFGYFLYASLYAAVGSAVENEGDSSQLQIPISIPLMIGFFIAFYAYNAPDSAVVFWGSIIPFTSPIVMLARLPYGVAAWELILSIVLLIATCFACAWASAKIYKAGILMFGKKSTWKDLFKWLKQS